MLKKNIKKILAILMLLIIAISSMQVEDLQEIANDIDVKNIILLRKNIKNVP